MSEAYLAIVAFIAVLSYKIGYKKGYNDGHIDGFDYRGKCVYRNW